MHHHLLVIHKSCNDLQLSMSLLIKANAILQLYALTTLSVISKCPNISQLYACQHHILVMHKACDVVQLSLGLVVSASDCSQWYALATFSMICKCLNILQLY